MQNELQEKIKQYMGDPGHMRRENLAYLRYHMKILDQEKLINWIKEMNLKELQYCQGAGIPGHANTIALELIKERKDALDKYLSGEGSSRIAVTKVEKKLSLISAETTDIATGEFTEDPPIVEVDKNVTKRVRPSKE